MDEINANWLAYGALIIWPIVALYLYSRLPVGQATLWTILGGYLLLPSELTIKFKMIPAFNKETIPNIAALLGCTLYAGRLPKFFREFRLAEFLVLLILVGPFITSLLNGDTIRIGDTILPGVGAYDAGSAMIFEFFFMLSFFIGREFLRSPDDNFQTMRIMVISGLAYSLPILFELRMSPSLSYWIYGYYARSIITEFREGGFRPVVFLTNGLTLALFMMTTAVAATALWRIRRPIAGWSTGMITGYLSSMLLLCKTLGALTYGIIAVPLVRWATPRVQMRVACILVTIALAYPIFRVTDLVPTTSILDAVRVVSVDRADSLNTRFVNEEELLKHAWERPWFGWGRYGRSRVYEGWLGSDSSITDGYWIIILGEFGIIGFIGTFGLLSLSVYRAATALRFAQGTQEAICLSTLSLIVAFNIFDLLPNASNSCWLWLLTGSLLGRAEALRAKSRQPYPPRAAPPLVSRPAL